MDADGFLRPDFFCRFDAAYGVRSTQAEIFANEVDPQLEKLFSGINTTVFCYGNTGAGSYYALVLRFSAHTLVR